MNEVDLVGYVSLRAEGVAMQCNFYLKDCARDAAKKRNGIVDFAMKRKGLLGGRRFKVPADAITWLGKPGNDPLQIAWRQTMEKSTVYMGVRSLRHLARMSEDGRVLVSSKVADALEYSWGLPILTQEVET